MRSVSPRSRVVSVRTPRGEILVWRGLTLIVALLATAGPLVGTARASKAPRVACKPGTVPKLTGPAGTARLVTRRGKAVCVRPPAPKRAQLSPAPTTPQGVIEQTVDQLQQSLTVKPGALGRVERRVGKRAARGLAQRTMSGWRPAARAAARRASEQGYRFEGSFGDPAKGTSGSARLEAGPAGEGGAGIAASAAIEFSADAQGLKDLGADKLAGGKSAKVRLDVSFADAPAQCPTAAGKVRGTLKATATLTITVDKSSTTISASVDVAYVITVGGDARWATIDDVDVQTTFEFGGSGQATETWRGRRGGSGFGKRGIFGAGAGAFNDALAEQQSHVNPNAGGVWGPRGRVLFGDSSTDNIFNYGGSIARLKGLVATDIATNILLYAAVEYVRQVVAPRGDRFWHDAEGCLRADGTPDAATLGPGQSTTVTVRNARAADGTPAAATLSATGVASLSPALAALPPAGIVPFTLTAPTTTPTRSSWEVVARSPAGKKTLTGSLADQPKWQVTITTTETFITAVFRASASLTSTLIVEPIPNVLPQRWNGAAALQWSGLSGQAEDGCSLSNPVTGGTFVAEVSDVGGGQVSVALGVSQGSDVVWALTCPDSEGSVPVFGPMPVILNTVVLTFPAAGGAQPLRVEVTDGPDGVARSEGTVTLTPVG